VKSLIKENGKKKVRVGYFAQPKFTNQIFSKNKQFKKVRVRESSDNSKFDEVQVGRWDTDSNFDEVQVSRRG
jgi:hypothetical protein